MMDTKRKHLVDGITRRVIENTTRRDNENWFLRNAQCEKCQVPLTSADVEAKRCTQCGARLEVKK